ncbi:MAG: hypothetical protein ACI30W_07430 [Muribaculaceae bacterium]
MKRFLPVCVAVALAAMPCAAHEMPDSATQKTTSTAKKILGRLSLGGYGEAVYSHNFYSDNYLRYSHPDNYRGQSHGRFDVPHVAISIGFDFGKGWSMGSEIEFEHGGYEAATEIETEEAGEYETEVERGGEVALEQFWIQKSFMPQLNVRAGLMVVPVGQTNAYHLPNEFFGVYRPEGENTILPCTWREVGLSIWGRLGRHWRYEAMVMPGLDSERFGNQGWIHDGSASPYEFKIGNTVAGALRIDNTSVPGLKISLSGYVGNSFANTLYPTANAKNAGIHGTVAIVAAGFIYNDHNVIVRGSFDYGHLSDSKHITDFNRTMSKDSPSKRQDVAESAIAAGLEAGYNLFGFSPRLTAEGRKLYVFGRFDYYDSMHTMEVGTPAGWCGRKRIAAGLNYYPISQVIIKGEYAIGLLDKSTSGLKYNNEPSISVGVAYTGWFL